MHEQGFEVLFAEEFEEDDNTGLPRVQLQYLKHCDAVKNSALKTDETSS